MKETKIKKQDLKPYEYIIENNIFKIKNKYIYSFMKILFIANTQNYDGKVWLEVGISTDLGVDSKLWEEKISSILQKIYSDPVHLISNGEIIIFHFKNNYSFFKNIPTIQKSTAEIIALNLYNKENKTTKKAGNGYLNNYYLEFKNGLQGFVFKRSSGKNICLKRFREQHNRALTNICIKGRKLSIIETINYKKEKYKKLRKNDKMHEKINLYIDALECEFPKTIDYMYFFTRLEKIKNHPEIIPLYQSLQFISIFEEKDRFLYSKIVEMLLPYIQNDNFVLAAEKIEGVPFPLAPVFDIEKMKLQVDTDIHERILEEIEKHLSNEKIKKLDILSIVNKKTVEIETDKLVSHVAYYRETNGIFYTLKEEQKALNAVRLNKIYAKHVKKFAFVAKTEKTQKFFDLLVVDIDLSEQSIYFVCIKNREKQKSNMSINVNVNDCTFYFPYKLSGIKEIFARVVAAVCNKIYNDSGKRNHNYSNGNTSGHPEYKDIKNGKKDVMNPDCKKEQKVAVLKWKEKPIESTRQYSYASNNNTETITNKEKKIYIRRGHWQSYWYGKRNSPDRCKQLKWVEATIVNRGLTQNILIEL